MALQIIVVCHVVIIIRLLSITVVSDYDLPLVSSDMKGLRRWIFLKNL